MSACNATWFGCALGIAAMAVVSAQSPTPGQAPPRDTPAQRQQTTASTARIRGVVVAADTGRAVRRARVFIAGTDAVNRALLTDDDGRFDFAELPAGRYTVSASKTGYLNISYGQRRPLQAGTPIQLADGQTIEQLTISLPRGSVVSGHIYDELGDPLPGATVRLLRYQYAQGNRQLIPAGNAETDDRGAFRIWGLNPGEYYVAASSRALNIRPGQAPGGLPFDGRGGQVAAIAGRGGRGAAAETPAAGPRETITYAPTYYPGVPSVEEARAVTVGVSAESSSIDFGIMLVRTGRVSGRAGTTDGSPVAGNIVLTPEGGAGRGGFGQNYSSRIGPDGAFAIANVPPGRYVVRARGGRQDAPLFAEQPLSVAGDVDNIILMLAPGATLTGTVVFRATNGQQVPDASQVRLTAPAANGAGLGPNPTARVDRDGRFTLTGVASGPHFIRPQGATRGWALASVTLAGREIIDTPLDVRASQSVSGITLTFTDKLTELNGTLSDTQNAPVPDYTVLAFPTDSSLWRPQARQIMTTRPDQNGRFQIRGLPAGDYYVTPIDPSQPGEWFEPAFLEQLVNGAARISLGEGDVRTQDFRLTPQ